MNFAISQSDIKLILRNQLRNFFLLSKEEETIIDEVWNEVIEDLEYCFSKTDNKYYIRDGETFFNPYHSGQYSIFLYFLSRQAYLKANNTILADKIYYLNKIMNGCDIFYQIALPRYFKLDHPVGTVLGRAKYGEGFTFLQCCTVGNNKSIYPEIGNNVKMCANSYIIGNCHIGNNVIIGACSGVKDCDVPDDTIVFGHYPNNVFKKRKNLQV